jgi:hypothetical protein
MGIAIKIYQFKIACLIYCNFTILIRKTTCWVIGDRKFVQEVTGSVQARRLRISRLEREGISSEILAAKVCKIFKTTVEIMKRRQRGGRFRSPKSVCFYCGKGIRCTNKKYRRVSMRRQCCGICNDPFRA